MPQPVELSRQFLSDTGGWKEMKEARAIHAAGRVSGAVYRGGLLEAEVREGAKTLKVRLEIRSRTDVVNHCPCFRARRDGIICAHALAAGLEAIDRSFDESLRTGLDVEALVYDRLIPTRDRREALAAFGEKRKPVFEGR